VRGNPSLLRALSGLDVVIIRALTTMFSYDSSQGSVKWWTVLVYVRLGICTSIRINTES